MTLALVASSALLGGCSTSRKITGWAANWIPGVGGSPTRQTEPVAEKTVRTRHLALTARLDPFPVKLSDTRRIEVDLRLKNTSTRFIQLEFPTTQRFDVTVQNEQGELIAQWSDDQAFEPVSSHIGINPGEHLEYKAVLSTRDLLPGKSYRIAAFFQNRDDLRAEFTLVPQK